MSTKKQDSNKIQTKGSVRIEVVRQQKNAYYLAKYLRAKTNKDMSYIISTRIKYLNGLWIPVTEIRELPEIQIHHDLTESEEEFLKKIDIENIEG